MRSDDKDALRHSRVWDFARHQADETVVRYTQLRGEGRKKEADDVLAHAAKEVEKYPPRVGRFIERLIEWRIRKRRSSHE